MSLEKNKNDVELKELYSNVLEAIADMENLPATYAEIEENAKERLQSRIESLKSNSEYETEATDEEKEAIENWYQICIA